MSSTPPYADDPPPKYTPTPTTHPHAPGPSSPNAGPLAQPASENTPLLPQVEVPARPRSRYRSREELRWCTCCHLCGACIIYYIALLGSFAGFFILLRETVLAIFLLFYIPVGFIVWFFICQIIVYRARMQELREFGPEEGIVTVRVL